MRVELINSCVACHNNDLLVFVPAGELGTVCKILSKSQITVIWDRVTVTDNTRTVVIKNYEVDVPHQDLKRYDI